MLWEGMMPGGVWGPGLVKLAQGSIDWVESEGWRKKCFLGKGNCTCKSPMADWSRLVWRTTAMPYSWCAESKIRCGTMWGRAEQAGIAGPLGALCIGGLAEDLVIFSSRMMGNHWRVACACVVCVCECEMIHLLYFEASIHLMGSSIAVAKWLN